MEVLAANTIIPKYTLMQSFCNKAECFHAYQEQGDVVYEKNYFLAPHRKDYYLFAFVKKGDSRHWVDMVPYTLQENSFYFTVPHQIHLKEDTRPINGYIICFTNEFLSISGNDELSQLPIIQNLYNGHQLKLNNEDVAFLEDLSGKIVKEYESTADWKNSMLNAYLRVLLIYLSRIYTAQYENAEPSADKKLLKRFQAAVEEHYLELHDVASYAQLLNISAGHLSEAVKYQSGKTAIEHIHERMLLEAKRLLFHTELSVKEMAFKLNFSDVSYFARFFKRLSGYTPLTFRSEVRKKYHAYL